MGQYLGTEWMNKEHIGKDFRVYGRLDSSKAGSKWDFITDLGNFSKVLAGRHLRAEPEGAGVIDQFAIHEQETDDEAEDGEEEVVDEEVFVTVGGQMWHYFGDEKNLEVDAAEDYAANITEVKGFEDFNPNGNLVKLWLKLSPIHPATDRVALNRHLQSVRITAVREDEFMMFFVLLVAASLFHEKGLNLWKSQRESVSQQSRSRWDQSDTFRRAPDFDEYMSYNRFEEIRKYIKYAFVDTAALHAGDEWAWFRPLVDRFNANRREHFDLGAFLTIDESIFAWRPRASKTGGLPHLTHEPSKPEDLGTMVKNTADPTTGVMIAMEIQEGKTRMEDKRFQMSQPGFKTAATTVRCVEDATGVKLPDVATGRKRCIVLGDSWFASVKCANALKLAGHHFTGNVKGNNAGKFPRAWLIEKLKDARRGSHCVLNTQITTDGENVDLFAIGYKYNQRRVLTFISTRGKTTPGDPYIAHYTDDNGHLVEVPIPRPELISDYFNRSGAIDENNASRQGEMALEKCWLTQDCWFRLITSMTAVSIVDTYKLYKYLCGRHGEDCSDLALMRFVDQFVKDGVKYCEEVRPVEAPRTVSVSSPEKRKRLEEVAKDVHTAVSYGTVQKKRKTGKEGKWEAGDEYPHQVQKCCLWCSRVLQICNQKTSYYCELCTLHGDNLTGDHKASFCKGQCFALHVKWGMPPLKAHKEKGPGDMTWIERQMSVEAPKEARTAPVDCTLMDQTTPSPALMIGNGGVGDGGSASGSRRRLRTPSNE